MVGRWCTTMVGVRVTRPRSRLARSATWSYPYCFWSLYYDQVIYQVYYNHDIIKSQKIYCRTTLSRILMSVCILRGRAGLIVILYVSFHLFEKKIIFRSSHTISSIIVACETRLTENGISPEPNLCCCKLNILDRSLHSPQSYCTTSKLLKSTPCCVCIL